MFIEYLQTTHYCWLYLIQALVLSEAPGLGESQSIQRRTDSLKPRAYEDLASLRALIHCFLDNSAFFLKEKYIYISYISYTLYVLYVVSK